MLHIPCVILTKFGEFVVSSIVDPCFKFCCICSGSFTVLRMFGPDYEEG